MNHIAQLIRSSYLADLNAILNRQDISNQRKVFEQMILSLLRVLYTLENIEYIHQFLAKVLDRESSLLNFHCAR